MRAEIIVSVLIFLTGVCGIYSQLSCVYYDKQYYGYACNLTINNPSGLDNFKRISGRHLSGKANKDVKYIISNSASNTTTIPSFICKNFKNLTDIELRSMGIQYIGENSFKDCHELLKLDLYGNRISKIDEKAFENNQRLSTLYLYQNRLSELPEKIFLNQPNLVTLWLDGNSFTSFPKIALAPLKTLNNLDFQGNQVKNLTVESFMGLENLRNLNLGSNRIEDLPRYIFNNLTSLTSITLSYNKLKIIHSFGSLPNLTQIYLSYNKIEAVSRKIIDNTGVTNLNIAGNVCANFAITDNSGSRELLKNGLRSCFEKYNEAFSNGSSTTEAPLSSGCDSGNITARICDLEEENEEFHNDLDEIQSQIEKLIAVTEELGDDIESLTDQNQELAEQIENLIEEKEELEEKFSVAIEELREQVEELISAASSRGDI